MKLTKAPILILLASGCILLAPASLRADDSNVFEALRSGRVRRGACGDAETFHVGSPGRDAARMRADGSYRLDGLGANVPVRAIAAEVCAEGGPGGRRAALVSGPQTLGPGNAFAAKADLSPPGDEAELVHGLDMTGPAGMRTVVFPTAGSTARLSVRGETAQGQPYGGALGPLESPAIRLESTEPGVASVAPNGDLSSTGPGFAWVRAHGDGEWTAVLASVDFSLDSDGDGMPDSFEIQHGFNPSNPADGDIDSDADFLKNRDEYLAGTNPRNPDTDEDLLLDGQEIQRGTNPLNPDTDGDTTQDGSEVTQGLDPLNPNEKPGPAFTPAFRNLQSLGITAVRMAVNLNDYAFVVATDGRLRSYFIDPFNPFVVFRDVETLSADLRDIAVEGATAYVAAGAGGLHIVDVSNPAVLVLTNTVAGLGTVSSVIVQGGVLFLGTDTGLRILTVGAGGAISPVGSLALPAVSRIAATTRHAFIGLPGTNRLAVVDVSDLAAPRELQRFAMPASTTPFREIAASGAIVFVAHGSAGLIVLSAADPSSLAVIDSAAVEFGAAVFDAVSVQANRLAAHTPAANARAQLFRIRDDGQVDRTGEVDSNSNGAIQIVLNQNYLAALSPGAIAISVVLPAGDRGSTPPAGSVFLEGLRDTFAPGEEITIVARVTDDVYLEGVDFFLDGRPTAHDAFPPFRLRLKLDPARPGPYEIAVSANGVDLNRNRSFLGAFLVRVEPDLDGDRKPNAIDRDADGDGVSDLEELYPGADGFVSDPTRTDTDGDGLPDGEEALPGSDGFVTDAGSSDTDGDGLTDPYEVSSTDSDPTKSDTDGDGTADGEEDLDLDGLANRDEAALGANPRNPDTDGDGLLDGLERDLGLDPTRPDTDGDGIVDGDEDFDGDGLANQSEVALGTDPRRADSDADGFDDPTEIDLGTDPASPTDFSARTVVFNSRTVVVRGPLTVGVLTLNSSILTVPGASGRSITPIELTVAGALTVGAGSRIDASGKGYPGGRGPGNPGHLGLGPQGLAPGGALTGGSHGGLGGTEPGGSAPGPQDVFGDLREPASAGGGGSADAVASTRGGSGGGVIVIRASTLRVDGVIAADGEGAPNVTGTGGGAGGSIRIACGGLMGSGSVSAHGGTAGTAGGHTPGAGGGGRIVIEHGDASGFDFARVAARGGGLQPGPDDPQATGGAGTTLLSGPGGASDLVIENGGRAQSEPRTLLLAPLGGQGGASEEMFDRLTVKAKGSLKSEKPLKLVRAVNALVLSGGALEAPEVRIDQAAALEMTDAALAVDSLVAGAGSLTSFVMTRSTARIGSMPGLTSAVLDASELAVEGPIGAGSLELRGSVLTVEDPTVDAYHPLDLTVSNTLRVDATSRIDLTGKGFVGGYEGDSANASGQTAGGAFAGDPRTGGSHAGEGGLPEAGGTTAPAVHGDLQSPDLPGGGGSAEPQSLPAAFRGGNGGGLARIVAGTVVLEGLIDASGAPPGGSDATRGGAGAGGAVRINTGVLRGAGSIVAAGGTAGGNAAAHGGAGGGGRIAIVYVDRTAFTGSLRAPGGALTPGPAVQRAIGGAGLVFTRQTSAPKGDLAVDAEGLPQRGYTTRITGGGGTLALSRLVVRGGARLESERVIAVESLDAASPDRFILRGGLRGQRLELPETPFLDLDQGELDVETIAAAGEGVDTITLSSSSRLVLSEPLTARFVSLTGESAMSVRDATAARTYRLDLTVTETLTIEAGSSVDLAGKGYVGGNRHGNASAVGQTADHALPAAGGRTGGGHGALGGFQGAGAGLGTSAAPTFDDFKDPRRPGGGGSGRLSTTELAYNGGGLARIRAKALVLSGLITVEGDGKQRAGNVEVGGGGGGGGLRLDVETLSGAGEISADGGAADGGVGSGAGGGGRIAIYYADRSAFTGSVHAIGGTLIPAAAKTTSVGGAGTMFWKGPGQQFGDLIADNGNRSQSTLRTQLRPVGTGTIATLAPATLGVSGTPFPVSDTGLEGRWVVVNSATLTPFLILTNDASSLTTDPASGDMTSVGSTGDAYRGAIVLDNLTVTRRAAMTTLGEYIIIATGAATVSDGGTLTAPPIVHW